MALASRIDSLTCVWGHPGEGAWIGGRRYLFNYGATGGTLIVTDLTIRAIWGSGPEDVFYVCDERTLMHWRVERCEHIPLPGDDDEEWSAVAGADGIAYLCGPSGFMLRFDGRRLEELPTDTTDLITGAVCHGPDLYVTTDRGQIRHFDGRRWRTVAFSAFGALRSICFVDGVVWACGDRGIVIQHQPERGE